MKRTKALDTAKKLISKDRDSSYGPALESLCRIAARWSITLGVPVRPHEVAMCMIDIKMARLNHSPAHEDSWIDVAGYAALGVEMATGE